MVKIHSKSDRGTNFGVVVGIFVLIVLAALRGMAAEPANSAPAEVKKGTPRPMEVEGRVVCLPERLHDLYDTELSAEHQHVYGFETQDGELFTLLRTRFSEALFADAEVQKKQLRLKGRLFPRSHVLDVTRISSVREGVVYDLHYWCDVCAIESVAPGPCVCCQGTVQLRETPVR